MAETNQLLINYYKKEETKKVKRMMEEKLEVGEILKSVNMEWISKEEVLNILGEDYEPVINESKIVNKDKSENVLNTPSVIQNTPMEIARKYKKYFEEYNQNRKEICKDKNISNGTFQKYLRLNYLIPELLLTILSSVAQQESEIISSHVKLGLKMKQQRGELIGYNGCLGYTYDKENKSISINQEEAEIVKYIFNRYAQGVGSSIIARELTNMKYLTPKGLTRWSDSTVRRILKNEKYKGDVLQGKTYTTDPITHKRVINMGEENQYYIKEHHTAIIEPELFEKVQQILEKRAGSRSKGKRRGNYSRKYPFSSRIYCEFCGTVLTRRNWNSKTKNETPVWHCMNFVKRGKQECPKCKAMRETVIENCFVDVYKILCSNKGDIVNKFITRINSIITENSSNKLIENIETEKEKLKSKMNKLIDLSLENAIDRETFLERKERMQNQIEQLNLKQEKLVLDERNKTNRKLSLNKLKRYLENGEIITEFDKDAFEILVKQVIIGGYDKKDKADPKQVTFMLKNERKVNYEDYL